MDNEDKVYYKIGDLSMAEHLEECIKINGLEGTEEIICKVYSHKKMHQTRGLFLNALYKKYKK